MQEVVGLQIEAIHNRYVASTAHVRDLSFGLQRRDCVYSSAVMTMVGNDDKRS
jgi:hypothetical protein